MSLVQGKKIAIVGGGPGGLTLARLLQTRGADVTVYERDKDRKVRVQGATLDLHQESGLKALEAAGLMDVFKANYRPGADRIRIMNQHAAILFDQHSGPVEDDFGSEWFRPEIDRGPLRNMLLDSLASGTVVWDSQLTSLSQQDTLWQLEFKSGIQARADLVIGADGANSKVRPFITGIRPYYAGISVLEGIVYDAATVIPQLHQLVNDGKIFAFGDSRSLILSAKGDGSIAFYAGFKAGEDVLRESGIDFSNKVQVADWFFREFAGWSDTWRQLFEQSDSFMPRPQYCMPADQIWDARPDITLLGDAAHLMPPYAGEGVNMAMLDALELSNAIMEGEHASLHDAIAAYEAQMRVRAAAVATMTLEQTELLHAPESAAYMVQMMTMG